jgi:hypothetical protein
MRTAFLFMILACAGAAQITISQPRIGLVRDAAGRLHYAFGTAGAFVLGPEVSQQPDADAPAAEVTVHGRVIRLEDRKTLVIHFPDGHEKRIPLAQPAAAIRHIGTDWLFAPPFAIHLTTDGADIFRLPAAEATR